MKQKTYVVLVTLVSSILLYTSSQTSLVERDYVVLSWFIICYLMFKFFSIPLGRIRMTVSEALILALIVLRDPAGAVWMVLIGQGIFWTWRIFWHRPGPIRFTHLMFRIFYKVLASGLAGMVYFSLHSRSVALGLTYTLTVLTFWLLTTLFSIVFIWLEGEKVSLFYPKEVIRPLIYYRAILALLAPILVVVMQQQGYRALAPAAALLLVLGQGFASEQLKRKAEALLLSEQAQKATLRESNQKMTAFYQEVSQQANELKLLYTVANLINNSVVAERSLGPVLECIASSLDCTNVAIFSLSVDKSDFVLLETMSLQEKISLLNGELGLLTRSVSTGSIVTWENGQEIEPHTSGVLVKQQVNSGIAVPIKFGNEPIGVLSLYNCKWQGVEKSTALLEGLADQLGTAVEHIKNIRQMENLAVTDGLTGVYNYRYFARSLEFHQTSVVPTEFLSLIVLDVDLFKSINDTYGHQTGDIILRKIAGVMKENVRHGDLVCRTGGEEFTIIMPGTSSHIGFQVAERLRESIANLDFSEFGLTKPVTVSIGIASHPENTDNVLHLPKLADEAMYTVKRQGRNGVANCIRVNSNSEASKNVV